MLRNMLFSAMLTFFVFVVGLTLALGGCGKKGGVKNTPVRKDACPVPEKEAAVKTKIGDDAGKVGRLEEEATVTARVYYADSGETDPGRVKVMPGTWLVPGPVFVTPDATGKGSAAATATGEAESGGVNHGEK